MYIFFGGHYEAAVLITMGYNVHSEHPAYRWGLLHGRTHVTIESLGERRRGP